jgi:hypothetical protein
MQDWRLRCGTCKWSRRGLSYAKGMLLAGGHAKRRGHAVRLWEQDGTRELSVHWYAEGSLQPAYTFSSEMKIDYDQECPF